MTDKIEDRVRRAARGLDAGDVRAAALRLAGRADETGALDVAYARVDSPFGPLLAAATERGLVRLAYPDIPEDAVLEDLSRCISPRMLERPANVTSSLAHRPPGPAREVEHEVAQVERGPAERPDPPARRWSCRRRDPCSSRRS